MTKAGLGQSTAVGIGGDPIVGRDTVEIVEMFEKDPETDAIVVIGEIGGDAEERLAMRVKTERNEETVWSHSSLEDKPRQARGWATLAPLSPWDQELPREKFRRSRQLEFTLPTPSQIPMLVKEQLGLGM